MNESTNNDSWLTVAPIGRFMVPPKMVSLPYSFGNEISIRKLPSWITSDPGDDLDQLAPRLRQTISDLKMSYCVAVNYSADALGTTDPNSPFDGSYQDTAMEKIHLVFLSMWLAKPTGMYFREVAHCEHCSGDWLVRQIGNHDRILPLPSYQNEQIDSVGLENARRIFRLLYEMTREGPIWSAVCSLGLALTQANWSLRYLVFWLVLEALFGPDDARETTFRISQRIAFFLGDKGAVQRELFQTIKECYKWRSKIVHGMRLKKLKEQASVDLITELEHSARKSMVRILENVELMEIFRGRGREKWLDGLVFGTDD